LSGILHIDFGKTFRGGQRQCYNLIRYLKQDGIDSGCVVTADSELEAKLKELNVPAFPVSYSGFDIVAEATRLKRVCNEMGYVIAHAHDSHGHNLALTLKFINPSIRVVVTRRVLSGKDKVFLSRWKYTTRSIDLFIAVSSQVKDELIRWGVSDSRLIHIPSGIDTKYFRRMETDAFRQRYGIPDRKHYIGTACALDENKDVETLLNSVAKLSYKQQDFILLIAGQGDRLDEYKRLAKFIEIEEYVRFLGMVDEMPQFYSLLDVYVLSSRSEGLGTSLLEAGACGCPVISSRSGGPEDYIRHGKNGCLFDVEDDETLADLLERLLSDEKLRMEIAGTFKKTVERFDIENVSSEIAEQYRRLAVMAG
jgi:glycosyltransferase involved in cell wall biosynthesis